jgi:hypothetical protein
VLGGSLSLLKWLVDDHCCPLRSLRVGGRRQSRGSYTPILTSRGRSLLGIAMENRNLEIIRYLVADKNMSLADEKGLSMETTIATLEAALRRLPAESDGTIPEITETTTVDSIDFIPTPVPAQEMSMPSSHVSFAVQSPQETSPTSTSGSGHGATSRNVRSGAADDASSGSVDDAVSGPPLCRSCLAESIAKTRRFPTFIPVHHLLCKYNRLCSDTLRPPDLLHAMQHTHYSMPSLLCRLLLYARV